MGSSFFIILNLFSITFSKYKEHVFSSIKIVPFFILLKKFKIYLGSTIWSCLSFFSLKSFVVLFFSTIKKTCFSFVSNRLLFGIGLVGLSNPLIFNSHATFSGAVINK